MSESLQAFYDAYAAWLRSGADDYRSPFRRGFGLCRNLLYWASYNNIRAGGELGHELRQQFVHFLGEKIDKEYPFNGGQDCYSYELVNDICHLNEARRAWVFFRMTKE